LEKLASLCISCDDMHNDIQRKR